MYNYQFINAIIETLVAFNDPLYKPMTLKLGTG